MKPTLAMLAVGSFCVACAAGPPPPPPEPVLDLVGIYDYTTEVQGMEMTGTMTITEADGVYSGLVSSDMGPILLGDFSIDGMEVTCVGEAPDMVVFFLLIFDEGTFTGDWDADGMSGAISGTKR